MTLLKLESITPQPRSRVFRPEMPMDQRTVALAAPDSFEADQYRVLKHRIERVASSRPIRSIAITSPELGDGKTTTALNLAATFAQTPGLRTLLVDADVRRPAVLDRLGLEAEGTPGLADLIERPGRTAAEMIGRYSDGNLWLLPAGRCPEEPYRLAESPSVPALFAGLHDEFDRIVVDLPPLLPVLDARVLLRSCDATLLVVAARRTRRRHIEEALRIIDPDRLLGVVLNGDEGLAVDYDGYRRYQRSSKEGRGRS